MMISRYIRHPKVFKQSFYDRSEAVWFPTSVIGMATLIIGTILFGIPRCGVSSWLVSQMMLTRKEWLVVAVEVWYYIFMFLSAMAALRVQSALYARFHLVKKRHQLTR